MAEPFKPHTNYTYRFDIGTVQHYLNARNQKEALARFRETFGPFNVRSRDVRRADSDYWRMPRP